jgi:hypothetical protein
MTATTGAPPRTVRPRRPQPGLFDLAQVRPMGCGRPGCTSGPTVRFLLGTHQPGWLTHAGVPLLVSDRRLRVYKTLPRAIASWAQDSGGFTELQTYGQWTTSPREYVTRARRYAAEIGRLDWVAPQDWMCEPIIINGGTLPGGQHFTGTHLPVAEHQRRTVLNYAQLRDLDPDLPVIPVVQGFHPNDYQRCVDLYWQLIRLDLTTMPLIGVGSVCRRQGTHDSGIILATLHRAGLHRLHGFGFKTLGLAAHGNLLAFADPLAWSTDARHKPPLPGCTSHRSCANCLRYALTWRDTLTHSNEETSR